MIPTKKLSTLLATRAELDASLSNKLRKSILQQAIQGLLVEQTPNDEPTSVLMEHIKTEKQRLVKEGRLKKSALQDSVIYRGDDNKYWEKRGKETICIDDEIPFEIPNTWSWCRLESITYPVGNKSNQIQAKEIKNEGIIKVVSQGQQLFDGYCDDLSKRIEDLPLIMFGDHTRNVKFIDFPFVIGADGTKFMKPICVNPKYLYYWILHISSLIRNRGYARHYSLLKTVPVAIPPLEEQDRIVAKVEELFAVIEGMNN